MKRNLYRQLNFWLHALALLPVLPLYALQCWHYKKNMPKLPDAAGPAAGEIPGHPESPEPPFRLLTLGESTIAGVGCPTHREALTGQIAYFLNEKTGRPVHWQALGRTGIKAGQAARELVPKIPRGADTALDLVFIALGGNDTFRLNRPMPWERDFRRLLRAVRERQPACGIVIANLPTVWQFEGFTPLMRFVMGRLVRLHAGAIQNLPLEFPGVRYMNWPIDLYRWEKHLPPGLVFADFFADGVHPAPVTCRFWGEEIAAFVLKQDSRGKFGP